MTRTRCQTGLLCAKAKATAGCGSGCGVTSRSRRQTGVRRGPNSLNSGLGGAHHCCLPNDQSRFFIGLIICCLAFPIRASLAAENAQHWDLRPAFVDDRDVDGYCLRMPLSPDGQAKLRRRADRALRDPKALSFKPETYLVALDESGQKGVHFPMEKPHSYVVGGIVIPTSRVSQLRQVWQDHQEMVEGQEVKVKEYVAKFGAITSIF